MTSNILSFRISLPDTRYATNQQVTDFNKQVSERIKTIAGVKDVISVAESGLNNSSDIAQLREAGYHAFLIGESLMKADSPGDALRILLAEASTHVSSF